MFAQFGWDLTSIASDYKQLCYSITVQIHSSSEFHVEPGLFRFFFFFLEHLAVRFELLITLTDVFCTFCFSDNRHMGSCFCERSSNAKPTCAKYGG